MAAASTVINRVAKAFNRHDNADVLSTEMNSSTTSLVYSGILPAWGPGTVVEIEQELMLVQSVDTSLKTATVVRGWLNTTAATHAASSVIYVNPRVSRDDILDLFNDCLTAIFPTIYKVSVQTHTYDSSTIGYNMPSDTSKILSVQYQVNSNAEQWEHIGDFELLSNMNTSDFSGGNAVMIRKALPSAASIRVVYASPFTRFTAEANDMTSAVGLQDYMTDLLFYFSLNRLMVQEELENTQKKNAQSHQRSQESPSFLSVRTGEWYQARFQELLQDCKNRLNLENKPFIMSRYG